MTINFQFRNLQGTDRRTEEEARPAVRPIRTTA